MGFKETYDQFSMEVLLNMVSEFHKNIQAT
jgi:hypothetical protein